MTNYNTNYYENNTMTFSQYLSKVFTAMSLGLAISAVTSYLFVSLGIMYTRFGVTLMFGSIIGELAVAVYFSAALQKMSKEVAWTCFIMYSMLTGIALSSVFTVYSNASILFAFISTAVLFVCMAIIGHTTHVDLSKFGPLLMAGLLAMIITSLINSLFFHSLAVNNGLALLGVVIFLGLIAYDMQRLRYYYNQGLYSEEMQEKIMIYGALQLYLDFINLFLRVLQIFGRRRD